MFTKNFMFKNLKNNKHFALHLSVTLCVENKFNISRHLSRSCDSVIKPLMKQQIFITINFY